MKYFYGGAFNPMTKAHLYIIKELLKELSNDDFLVIGLANHDYKTYDFSFEKRLEILKANLVNENRILFIEQDQRTWKFLSEKFKDEKVTLVLGEDEYNDLKVLNIWHYSQEILDTFPIKVFSRSDVTKGISATKVRQLLKENANYEQLEKYITKETWDILKNEI